MAFKFSRLGRNKICSKRNLLGTTIAELPMAIWIIFVGIGMPLLALVLTTVRYGLFIEAAREAADTACSAQNYVTTNGSLSTPAVTLAQDTAVHVAAMFPGLNISPDDVNCYIVVTPLSASGGYNTLPSTIVGRNTPLSKPADSSLNLYQLKVSVTGQIDPFVSMPFDGFISVPGLNAPMRAAVSMTRVFQNPAGLFQAAGGVNGNQ